MPDILEFKLNDGLLSHCSLFYLRVIAQKLEMCVTYNNSGQTEKRAHAIIWEVPSNK